MSCFKRAFESIDFFGVHLMQKINENDKVQKSFIGGIITFLIFSSSLSYSFWVVFQWRTNQMSPKISHAAYFSDFSILDQDYDVIRFSFWQLNADFIDPFETNILVPIVTYSSNNTMTSSINLRKSDKLTNHGNYYMIPKTNVGFENGNPGALLRMYIWLAKCDQSLLSDDEHCASDDVIEAFFKQPMNTVLIELNYKAIDPSDKSIKQASQDFYIQLETSFCYTLNIFLQTTMYEINDSILFEPSYFKEYISGSSVQVQSNTVGYCQQAIDLETYAFIYVVLLGNQTRTLYEYPHAGDILANIGSIVSVLLLLQHIIFIVNNLYLENQIFKEIINIYYPQFQDIKVIRNWRGKISRVFYKKHNLDEAEKNQFINFMRNAREKIEPKFSFINLHYEISRLYFLVRASKNLDEIRKVHQIGIKLNFCRQDEVILGSELRSAQRSSSDFFSRSNYLNDEDFCILEINEKKKYKKNEILPDEMQNDNYYNINKI